MLLFTLDAKSQIGERRNEIRFGVTLTPLTLILQ